MASRNREPDLRHSRGSGGRFRRLAHTRRSRQPEREAPAGRRDSWRKSLLLRIPARSLEVHAELPREGDPVIPSLLFFIHIARTSATSTGDTHDYHRSDEHPRLQLGVPAPHGARVGHDDRHASVLDARDGHICDDVSGEPLTMPRATSVDECPLLLLPPLVLRSSVTTSAPPGRAPRQYLPHFHGHPRGRRSLNEEVLRPTSLSPDPAAPSEA